MLTTEQRMTIFRELPLELSFETVQERSLQNVESFTDTHVRVGNSDLPATRRIISFENGEVSARTILFENHQMLS